MHVRSWKNLEEEIEKEIEREEERKDIGKPSQCHDQAMLAAKAM